MFKTLRSRVIASYFLVVIICLALASLFFLFFLSRYHRDQEMDDLKRQVGAVAQDITRVNTVLGGRLGRVAPGPVDTERPRRLVQGTLDSEAQVLKAKLVLTDGAGQVVAEARVRPLLGRRKVVLPENLRSQGGVKVGQWSFAEQSKKYMFASAPVKLEGEAQGSLTAFKPNQELGGVASSLIWYVVLAGIIALGLSMLLALYLSNAISRPVKAVTEAARKMAAGDYRQVVQEAGSDETSELARDFNLMAERVRTSYELQRNFVGNVSHELRTPLTSIEGFSQALLDGVSQSEDEKRRSLEIINQESKRLVRVLRDLLLLSQIDAGELRPERKQVDLVDLIRKMESIYHIRAQEEEVSLRVDTPGQALTMNTDPDGLERVLTNLIDNAMKYTDRGGTVALSVVTDVGWVHISIADTGKGISPERLPHIFDRFYRVEKSRSSKHGGSGLGLSICKELVETLGGRIRVQSLTGQGTTFTVTLPL